MKKAIVVLMLAAFLSAGATSVLAQTSEPEKQEQKSVWAKVKDDVHKVIDKFHKKTENKKEPEKK